MYKAAIIRLLSVGTSAVAGIVGIRSALSLDNSLSTAIVAMLSWSIFIGLGQLGWGRPIYALLRQSLLRNTLTVHLLAGILRITLKHAVVASLTFVCLIVLISIFLGLKNDLFSFGILSFGVSALGAATFWRDAAYALSKEENYELLELIRRLTLLTSLASINLNINLSLLGVICVAVAILTTIQINKTLRVVPFIKINMDDQNFNKKNDFNLADQNSKILNLRPDAKRYLVFSISELCLYNGPLLVYSIVSRADGIIDFSIWSKLFMFVVLPMRIIIDARLNDLMRYHFKGDGKNTAKSLRYMIILAIAIATLMATLTYVNINWLLNIIAPGLTWDSAWLPISIVVWGLLNALQHVFGSYTVSHGQEHSFAWSVSLATCVAVICTLFLGEAVGMNLGSAMCLAAIPYAISTFAFGRRALDVIPKMPSSSYEN